MPRLSTMTQGRVGRRVLLPLILAANLPVWVWYVRRMSDGSDEPYGLLSLIAFAVCWWLDARSTPGGRTECGEWRSWLLLAGLLAVFWLSWVKAPMLLRACAALFLLGSIIIRGKRAAGLWALLLLSLPWMATVEYFLGYPVRSITATLLAQVLVWLGQPVTSSGVILRWAGDPVVIDAPCGGFHMLWSSYLAAALLATLQQWSGREFWRQIGFCGGLVFAANLLRNFLLFHLETGPWTRWPGDHDAVGLLCFGLALWTFWKCSGARPEGCCGSEKEQPAGTVRVAPALRLLPPAALVLLGGAALLLESLSPRQDGKNTASSKDDFTRPPGHWQPQPLSTVELRWLSTFPGEMTVWQDGPRRLVLRTAFHPTRKLHPAEACFRGSGYQVGPRTLEMDGQGRLWALCVVTLGHRSWTVREGFQARTGEWFFDVSTLFWQAVGHPDSGPWTQIVLVEPDPEPRTATSASSVQKRTI